MNNKPCRDCLWFGYENGISICINPKAIPIKRVSVASYVEDCDKYEEDIQYKLEKAAGFYKDLIFEAIWLCN